MKVSKAYFGWVAESAIPLADGRAKQIVTCKRSDGRVWHTWSIGTPMARGGFSYDPFDSGNGKMLVEGVNRATRGAVEKAHLAIFEAIKKEMENV